MSMEINALALDLALLSKRAESDAVKVTQVSISKVSSSMRTFVPKDTWATHDSISDEVTVAKGTVMGESGPTTKQGFFMENGTYKDPPQAFAGPALDRHSGDYEKNIGDITEGRF